MSALSEDPIGIFDSGVGGLSVLRHIRALLPAEDLIYVADQAHIPYGNRPPEEIRTFGEAVTRFLLSRQAKLVVVACNTASGIALTHLRRQFPDVPFVGMEPAVKPAAARTQNGKVGVLATAGTFESQRYSDLMARFARDVEVMEDPCLGLVERIEAGEIDTLDTLNLLQRCLAPMLAAGVDTFVLGCTHYPFVLPVIRDVVGANATIIDPAPAVARQVGRVLQERQLSRTAADPGVISTFTTGDPKAFVRLARRLLDFRLTVHPAVWQRSGALAA